MKHAGNMDADLIEQTLERNMQNIILPFAERFNLIALLILKKMLCGEFREVADFEVKLGDLLDRTLLKDVSNRVVAVVVGSDDDINDTIGNA
jgi:hypothetical protein